MFAFFYLGTLLLHLKEKKQLWTFFARVLNAVNIWNIFYFWSNYSCESKRFYLYAKVFSAKFA